MRRTLFTAAVCMTLLAASGCGADTQPTGPAPNFWLLNLTTKAKRPLTHLTDRGRILTFDITPDGKAIVFDRIRDNSDIVLFDRDK